MKCHDCGAEVENLGYLKKHKAECPGKSGTLPSPVIVIGPDADAILQISSKEPSGELNLSTGFIPYSLCAEELPTLGVGTTVVLQVVGRLTEGGIVVEEAELL